MANAIRFKMRRKQEVYTYVFPVTPIPLRFDVKNVTKEKIKFGTPAGTNTNVAERISLFLPPLHPTAAKNVILT